MDWIQLLGAVGAGAIVTKLLDVLWVQRVLQDNEKRKWLREQRYRVYATLAREILVSGPFHNSSKEIDLQFLIADAVFLATEKQLIEELKRYLSTVLDARKILEQKLKMLTPEERNREERDRIVAEVSGRVTCLSGSLISRLRESII